MKFFVFMCCMAYLLTGISSRLRRTTPMSPALRSDDAEERQVAKFAEIIDFVNSANNDDRRSYFRRHGHSKRHDSRRLNEVMAAMYGFAELEEFEEFGDVMREIEEKIRHDVTEDPDVLMEDGVRQKNSNKEVILEKKDTSFDASKYSTAKLKDVETTLEVTDDNPNVTLHTNATVTSHDNATVYVRAQDDGQKIITDELINRRSLIHDKDDDKPITGRKKLANNEKQNSNPKAKGEHYDASPVIYKTVKFEKKTQDNKPSRKKDKAQLVKKEANKHNSKETVTNKEDNNEYRSTNLIYSQEKLNEDSIRPKDEPDGKINNKKDSDTNENIGKGKNQKDKSWDKNKNNLTSAERLILKVNNTNNKTHNNRDHIEQYSIHSHKEKSENSSKHAKKSHEKIDMYDKKMIDKYHDTRGERKSQWIKVDTQSDDKESLRDRNKDKRSKKQSDLDKNNDEWIDKEKGTVQNDDRQSKKQKDWNDDDRGNKKEKYWDKNDKKLSEKQKDWDNDDRWNKKEKGWDNDDKWNKKEKYWGKNDDRSSKSEKPRNKDDERWTIKEKHWNKKKHIDKDFDIMEYEWNKRHEEYDKYENDAQSDDNYHERNGKNFKEIYNDHKKKDREFNKRYNDWTKRGSERNNNRGRTYDRSESGNKKSYGSVDQERVVRRDRYKVVDRVDTGSSRNDDY